MFYDRELIETLESLGSSVWQGLVYRPMFAHNEPLLENRRGARWKPPGVPAIYTSLERETILAEAEHQIASQPLPPQVRRTIFTMRASLRSVLDLSGPNALAKIRLPLESLADTNWSRCQLLGGAAEWLGHDGLLVPSARAKGTNLVIYPNRTDPESELEVVTSEVIRE